MDTPEQAAAYAAADFAEVNQGFVDRFRAEFRDLTAGRVVDLGCGPGDIPIRLASELPGLSIVGLDGAASMIRLGVHAVEKAGLTDRVALQVATLPLASRPETPFDGGISNSLLHHLHDPMVLWTSFRDLLRPGAPLLVIDLFRPESEAEVHRIVDTYASGEPDVLRTDFHNSLWAAFTVEEVRTQLQAAGLGGLKVDPISDRHLCVVGRLPA